MLTARTSFFKKLIILATSKYILIDIFNLLLTLMWTPTWTLMLTYNTGAVSVLSRMI